MLCLLFLLHLLPNPALLLLRQKITKRCTAGICPATVDLGLGVFERHIWLGQCHSAAAGGSRRTAIGHPHLLVYLAHIAIVKARCTLCAGICRAGQLLANPRLTHSFLLGLGIEDGKDLRISVFIECVYLCQAESPVSLVPVSAEGFGVGDSVRGVRLFDFGTRRGRGLDGFVRVTARVLRYGVVLGHRCGGEVDRNTVLGVGQKF
jgi:hypothetical protein